MKNLYLTLTLFLVSINSYSQSELNEIVKANKDTIEYEQNQFKGKGWEKILSEIASHNNTLIGEAHFFNEIPLFVSEISSEIKFDNFFCEIDNYSGEFISQKIRTLPQSEFDQFIADYNHAFSFYALTPEFNLLEKLATQGTNIIGTDQIVLTADGLMASRLKETTKNRKAKEIYSNIEINSKKHFELFSTGKGRPYFLTDEFEQNLNKLAELKLSTDEQEVISDLKISRKIYLSQNHHLRIQLMKNTVLKNIEALHKDKNLFKYGALHINKAESSLGGYDIGNFVSNISDANFNSSLHIMIIGKNGMQGVPFKGMQPQKIDPSISQLKHFAPFYEASDNENWSMFDINAIQKAIKSNNLQVDNKSLLNVLTGYDYLIVIPNVTPAPLMN
ncbi:hypothetical protein [Aureibacter tunicatorum]|uniref:Uncharacterized protein n=1 Tax=Aureibacter tunicatorum TaxID=866807 RepID=A0AAE4BS70_9BACT|nr:hypothetical protein [Aureibacter tunicatorum]MDR6238570.1 hypothetical protein [Aureibacter tunicatorum]BDD05499.1 hypothetical protein AUTU_29820 [Aureibacter tunicatorum]